VRRWARASPPLVRGIALVAYFAVVVVAGLLPGNAGITHRTLVAALAFSPSDLASGRLWLLPLSAVVVEGETWAQLAVLAQAALALLLMGGARTSWRGDPRARGLDVHRLHHPRARGGRRSPDRGRPPPRPRLWRVVRLGGVRAVSARSWARAHAKAAVAATVATPTVALIAAGVLTPGGTRDSASVGARPGVPPRRAGRVDDASSRPAQLEHACDREHENRSNIIESSPATCARGSIVRSAWSRSGRSAAPGTGCAPTAAADPADRRIGAPIAARLPVTVVT
jgi:hypothetical protein